MRIDLLVIVQLTLSNVYVYNHRYGGRCFGQECGAFTLNEGNRSAPLRANPSIPPLFAQSTRDTRGSRGRLTFSSFFSSSRKADTPLTIVWKGQRKTFTIYNYNFYLLPFSISQYNNDPEQCGQHSSSILLLRIRKVNFNCQQRVKVATALENKASPFLASYKALRSF